MNALAVQAMIMLYQFKTGVTDRLRRNERGQTATEYTGIIVLVALIMVAIFGLGLDHTIGDALKTNVNKILKQ